MYYCCNIKKLLHLAQIYPFGWNKVQKNKSHNIKLWDSLNKNRPHMDDFFYLLLNDFVNSNFKDHVLTGQFRNIVLRECDVNITCFTLFHTD